MIQVPALPAADVVGGPRRQSAIALRREAVDGVRLAARLRLATVPVLMLFLAILLRGDPAALFVQGCLAVILLLGIAYLHVVRSDRFRPWQSYLLVTLDMALVGFAIFGSELFFDQPWPSQTVLHSRPVVYFFFVMAAVALSLSPALMLWAGVMAALVWSAGVAWLVTLPDTVVAVPPGLSLAEQIAFVHQPAFVSIDAWMQDVIVLLLTSLVLAGVVWRTRRLLTRQIAVARERANLARHFAPTMVDEIAGQDGMLEEVRSQDVAVLFADVVGFTRAAEALGPEATVALLRSLHRRLEKAVFDNGGTLDKFLGDGVMATFGTPRPTGADAANALRAGRAALAAVDAWNAKRARRGAAPIKLSVGIHHGPVVLGDVGSERRLEFAVIGDTVNVAARIEHLTRELESALLVSDALLAGARAEGAEVDDLLPAGDHALRGREASVVLWRLPR